VTRAHAERFNLKIAQKPDSQDICFVPNGTYANVIQKLRPGTLEAGDIIDLDGNVLGRHEGIIHYTIGQRKGLGIGGGAPLYVVRLDAAKHQVIVGPKEALAVNTLYLKDTNWLTKTFPEKVEVKVRSTQPPLGARVEISGNGAVVVLDEPEYGISSGQACVVYSGSRVLGGGWITSPQ
jgi:tRNA-specific 2-thiouridylase